MPEQAQMAASRCARCRTRLHDGAAFCHECGAPRTSRQADGPDLPDLELLDTLGTGGAADVYLAHQRSLDRLVAVKVLRRSVEGDDSAWRAFSREARTMARLSSHVNVVTLYTAGRAGTGQPYLVTEYVRGGSLDEAIRERGPLPPASVASIGAGLADALVAAHAEGIHHRDVKPGNVLLADDGRAKLTDFGIARLLDGRSVTTTDVFAFTPEHVAPEVLRHEPDGPWSDVYGLASTLATAVLGRPPVHRRPEEPIESFLTRKLVAPPPDLAAIPPALAAPLVRALDSDPGRRPTMAEFRDALAAASRSLQGADRTRPMPPGLPTVAHDRAVGVPGAAMTRHAERQSTVPAAAHPTNHAVWITALAFVTLAVIVIAVVLATGDDGARLTATTIPTTAIPTTATASTAAPATTIAPSAAPTSPPATTVPVTTAPPTTAAPTTAAAVATPPPTPQPGPAGREDGPDSLSQADAEDFVRRYFAQVAAGDYEDSWAQLAREFQDGRARSFDDYVEFWEENDVEVGDIDLVESDKRRAIVHVDLRWNDSDSWLTERFELRHKKDVWLIARQTTVDDD